MNRKLLRYRSRRNDEPLRLRLITLATQHRRYGLPWLIVLLRRDGVADNHKRTGRIYRSAKLQVRNAFGVSWRQGVARWPTRRFARTNGGRSISYTTG